MSNTNWNGFPVHALPRIVRDLAESIAVAHKSTDKIGVIALVILGIISGALGAGVAAKTEHFLSYPNLYVYCSVGSGGVKSVLMDEAMRPVEDYQWNLHQVYESEIKPDLLAKLRIVENKIEHQKEAGPEDEEAMKELSELFKEKADIEKALKFCPVSLEDVTPEAMVLHAIDFGKMFIASDEASIVADIICGRYSKGFSNDGPFSRLWSSGSVKRARVETGMRWRDKATGAMVLLGQEHITQQMFHNEDMIASGFIPRFLFADADTPMVRRERGGPTVSDKARRAYETVINAILDNHWGTSHDSATEIAVSGEAEDALNDFHNSYVDQANTTLAEAKRSLHRISEQATRLALLFHVVDHHSGHIKNLTDPISRKTTEAAIAVVDWSIQQYLEYSAASREDAVDALEKEVLEKATSISKKAGPVFTVRDVQHKLRSKRFEGASHIESILNRLVEKRKLTVEGEKRYKLA